MPIYLFSCCGREYEVLQGIDKDTPLCPDCGAKMTKLPTSPAKIEIKWGGIKTHTRGYKEDYAEDYRRRLQESKT